ncbi:methylmalonyl-CoA epimerase [Planococcus lenghuensis]|uniref:Methylmalonyl-CoA epimerase n=1 Tax=Planococcus lenghuensis TaxID=2213202 RepID=A0A1Q2KZV0_9BACL|nr:methylmalonyl-CoA epimerase [Planococcus lenghuensis]AQQ53347.1 methylmalonyl-CoA epimerase [Planococcus lenghuensis]
MEAVLDHIGVAVRSIDEALPFYLNVLNGSLTDRYTSNTAGVEVHVAVMETNGQTIELLEPTNNDSPIARFIRQKGKGVHHVAYQVDDLDQAILEARQNGVRFLEDTLRVNSRGRKLIYINPVSTDGTLIELCEYQK